MFCARITFLQYFKYIEPKICFGPSNHVTMGGGGGQTTPLLKVLKKLPKLYFAQNMLIYFRFHYLLYMFNRGVDASQANPLKKALD